MAQKQEILAQQIIKQIQSDKFVPVYYLMGTESYYIDMVSDWVEHKLLTEEEKEFNQIVLYATSDTKIDTIISTARRYPLMASKQVVIVKEAQNIRQLDKLEYYLKQPMQSTVLLFCHKNGSLDMRKKVANKITKAGGIFMKSDALRDYQLPDFIMDYVLQKKLTIKHKATIMLADHIGTDLQRMTSELDKLVLVMGPDEKEITPDLIETNIGISKEFNNFELTAAVAAKDYAKTMQIVHYFESNPKGMVLVTTLIPLYDFFANLMQVYYVPNKDAYSIARTVGLQDWIVKKQYIPAMRLYTGLKTMEIIGLIRYADAEAKGAGGTSSKTDGNILRELIFHIFH